jgi:hypothetical protein
MPLLLLAAFTFACFAQPFQDEAAAWGLNFQLRHDPRPEKRLIESMPGGIAVLDFDNDGWPDLFFTNGASGPNLTKTPADANRLFRNLDGQRFEDVTHAAGLAGEGYSMGTAAADFDNDGDTDLFVSGVRRNTLYRNQGGRFEDITASSGITSTEWSVTAIWLDYDRDGRLDLFVVNYGLWDPAKEPYCGDRAKGVRIYCHPRYYTPRPNQLFRNLGNGRFRDVTQESGIGKHPGRGMGVALGDWNRDGWPDLFVTNDAMPNFLFENQRNGTFREVALTAGAALMDAGRPVSSMGVAWQDLNRDTHADLVITALNRETFPLFLGSDAGFRDATQASGLARLTHNFGGWAVLAADFDHDGWPDLFTANSHVNDRIATLEASRYEQPNLLLRNRQGRFETWAQLGEPRVHRGAVTADFNRDGRLDLAVSSLGAPAELWINRLETGRFLEVRLQGRASNRDGIGARIQAAGQTQWISTACGYASSCQPAARFGLASDEQATVTVLWPSGKSETRTAKAGLITLTEPE